MSPAKRITKKQMKEDRLVTTAFKASEYLQKNPKPFLIGGSAAAIIFIAILLFFWNIDKKNDEAEGYLSRAQLANDRGLTNEAIADLKKVVDEFSSSRSASSACFTLSNILFDNRNYEEALQYFVLTVEKYASDKMKAASAAAGAGACHEQLGNRQEAGRYFKMAAALYPEEMWAPEYLLRAGWNFAAAGDDESARQAFNEIISKYAKSKELNTARRSLAEIKS
jgi:TolA-binding protein